jgi:hypothetical protein
MRMNAHEPESFKQAKAELPEEVRSGFEDGSDSRRSWLQRK